MDEDIFKTYQNVFLLRHAQPALRRGDFKVLETRDESYVFAFERSLGDERLVIILNRVHDEATLASDSLKGLKVIYRTDPAANTRRLPPLSAAVFGK
jgi:glycosidase